MLNIEFIKNEIESNDGVMLYFSGENCGVCEVLKPKIKYLFDSSFPKIKQHFIDASKHKDIAIKYGVFSVPTVLVFLDKKEFIRKSRNISIPQFEDQLKRAYDMFFN